jgi:dTDP-4-dehydrorhamnose reductase
MQRSTSSKQPNVIERGWYTCRRMHCSVVGMCRIGSSTNRPRSTTIVRTSLLFGDQQVSPHESAVHDAIEGRSTLSFFTDEIRSALVVDDLAVALVELAQRPELTGYLHLGGPEALSRAELAIRCARRRGWNESKLSFSTAERSGLTRPARVVLDSSLAGSHGLAVRSPSATPRL